MRILVPAAFWTRLLCLALLAFGGNALAASSTGYCPSRLDAAAQDEIFERVINIGASFTHGCITCDKGDVGVFHRLTNDGPWIRRNPVLALLLQSPWKNQRLAKDDWIAVYEHDSEIDVGAFVRPNNPQTYRGYWGYYPQLDTAALLSGPTIASLQEQPAFAENLAYLSPERRRNYRDEDDRPPSGVLYQWMERKEGKGQNSQARPFVLMDLATDGGRMHEFIRVVSQLSTFNKLYRSGWRDAALRNLIIEQAVARLAHMAPSSVIVFDALFWDAVVESFAYLYERKPSSLVLKVLKPVVSWRRFGADMDDPVKRQNIRADFLEILKRVSQFTSRAGRPVPVFVARLEENPLTVFRTPEMRLALSSLFGQALYRLTGEDYGRAFLQGLVAAQNKTSVLQFDFPYFDLFRIGPIRAADAMGGVAAGRLGAPWRQVVNASVQGAFEDLPLFLRGIDESFQKLNHAVNNAFRTLDSSHNLHVIDATVFYQNFPNLLNPETSHPSVVGARLMANTLEWEMCR